MDVVQWLKLCQLLVDWQSPRGTLTPRVRPGGMVYFFFSPQVGTQSLVRHKGGRKIFTHSLSKCLRWDPQQTKGVEGDRRRNNCLECYAGISSFQCFQNESGRKRKIGRGKRGSNPRLLAWQTSTLTNWAISPFRNYCRFNSHLPVTFVTIPK